jgi:hypothetical protein
MSSEKEPDEKIEGFSENPSSHVEGERKMHSRPSIANGSVEAIQQSTGLHLSNDSNSFARGSKAAYGHTRVQCFGIGYSLSNQTELTRTTSSCLYHWAATTVLVDKRQCESVIERP